MNLSSLREQLKKEIVGQDQMIDGLTISFWRHLLKLNSPVEYGLGSQSSNFLLIGRTGTGKTYTIRRLAALLNWPLIEINCKSLSQEGWQGMSFPEALDSAVGSMPPEHQAKAERSIVLLDEFDKLCLPNFSSKGTDNGIILQSALLKYVEGASIPRRHGTFLANTNNMFFVFCGAFTELFMSSNKIGFQADFINKIPELEEALINYGVMPDMLGRIWSIAVLQDMTENDYRELILNTVFISNRWLKYFRDAGIDTGFINYAKVINDACRKKCGVRGLIAAMDSEIALILEKHYSKENGG